jgi:hypothetical protein
MKKTKLTIAVLATAGVLAGSVACKKAEEGAAAVTEAVKEALTPSADAAKRAQAYGFASRLSSDVDAVMGFRNLGDVMNSFTGSNFFKQILQLSGGSIPPQQIEMAKGEAAKYIGKDLFIAFSDGSAEQFDRLMVVYDYYYKAMYPIMLQGAMAGMNGGAPGAGFENQGKEMFMKILNADNGRLMELAGDLQVPGILIGTRIDEGADDILAQLAGIEGQLPPTAVVSEIDVAGSENKFKSWTIAAKDAFGEAERAAMRAEFDDAEIAAKIEKIIDSKKVDFSFGKVGDYLIFSIGENHDHLKFAEKPEDSLVAKSRFDFGDAYLDKKLMAYSYNTKEMAEALSHPEQMLALTGAAQDFIGQMAQGGFDLGETGNLVGKAGEILVKMMTRECSEGLGIAFLEDGLKIESIGGYSTPGVDKDAKLTFANLISDDTFLAAASATTPEYEQLGMELLETVIKAGHEGASSFAKLQPDSEFGQNFVQMNAMFAPKLINLWTILKEKVQGGLGHQSGLYVDLKGSAPKIPGLPQVLINKGKVPRIVLASDVSDRAKLAAGWDEFVPALNDLAKSIPGQQPGSEFQLPDVTTFDNSGTGTHFIQMPFFGGDFLPSVTVNDNVMLMSTSNGLAAEIAKNATAGDMTGTVFQINFDSLRVFAGDWVKLVMENADEVFAGDEFKADSFREKAGMIQLGLEMMKVMKKINYHSFVEDDEWRGSTHIHFADIAPAVN